jgi:hypothetical protein
LTAELVEAPGAMSADQRKQRIAELEARLLAAERSECGLIEHGRELGTEILYRPETDPKTFLGVNVVATANHVAVEAA